MKYRVVRALLKYANLFKALASGKVFTFKLTSVGSFHFPFPFPLRFHRNPGYTVRTHFTRALRCAPLFACSIILLPIGPETLSMRGPWHQWMQVQISAISNLKCISHSPFSPAPLPFFPLSPSVFPLPPHFEDCDWIWITLFRFCRRSWRRIESKQASRDSFYLGVFAPICETKKGEEPRGRRIAEQKREQ